MDDIIIPILQILNRGFKELEVTLLDNTEVSIKEIIYSGTLDLGPILCTTINLVGL